MKPAARTTFVAVRAALVGLLSVASATAAKPKPKPVVPPVGKLKACVYMCTPT